MRRLRLADHADLAVYYEADVAQLGLTHKDVRQVFTREMFIDYYRNCPSIGFMYDEKPMGGIIFDHGYAHIAVLPEYHGHWAWLWEPALEWLFSIQPEVLGVVDAENQACLAFMKRNGWPAVSIADGKVTFRIAQEGRIRRRVSRMSMAMRSTPE
jgi:GNAT superfamily N-acetyltransferase